MKKERNKVRVKDIAKVLKISASTVSRALNDHPRISKETKEKVKQAASRLGYKPNMPELIIPEKTEAVAVLTPSLESCIYRDIVKGIHDYFNQRNYRTFIVDMGEDTKNVLDFFDTYKKYGLSGIIHIVADRNVQHDFYQPLIEDAMPAVTVFEPDFDTDISSVIPDMFQGVHKMMEYFYSHAIRKTLVLLEDEKKPEDHYLASAMDTVLDSMEKKNQQIVFYYEKKSLHNTELEKLIKIEKADALVVKGVLQTLEKLQWLNKKGIIVPEDLLLAAAGSEHSLSGLTNSLSLLKLPGYEMGYDAAALLLRQINRPETKPETVIKPVDFILKSSAIRMK